MVASTASRWFLSGLLALVGCLAPTDAPPVEGCAKGTRRFGGTVLNARDLGGIPTASGSVACGAIIRGAVPSSAAACDSFASASVRTVIDLREPSERQGVPDATCLPGTLVQAPMPIPSNVSPADYLADLDAPSVRTVFAAFGDETAYPVYFHCTYGRDRSGVIAALVLLTLDASHDEIVADYQRTRDDGLTTTPLSLEAVLAEVARRGGVEAHLRSIGVTAAQLATLRARQAPRQP